MERRVGSRVTDCDGVSILYPEKGVRRITFAQ